MGVTSSDSIQYILKKHKNEINNIKNEIKASMQNNQNDCINIVFMLMNGKNYSVPCFPNNKLFDIFLLLVDKAKDSNFSNLDKLKMYYNSVDITQNFNKENNKIITDLNFCNDNPIINVNYSN